MFITQVLKESDITTSENGAKKYSTRHNNLVDNFAPVSHFTRPITYKDLCDYEII